MFMDSGRFPLIPCPHDLLGVPTYIFPNNVIFSTKLFYFQKELDDDHCNYKTGRTWSKLLTIIKISKYK